MKRSLFTLSLLLCGGLLAAQNTQDAQTMKERLTSHVYYLASDSLRGREAGTPDALKAADYIQSEYVKIGLKPFFKDGYRQKFDKYTNIVALIEGSDPALKDEYIILGAHYDHLGVKGGKIYNGADDNASGSAALIEIARELYANRNSLKRSVIIAAFDAEELGLFGSEALAKELESTIGIDKIKLMMSIDMVGWYKASGKLKMEGVATIKDGKKIISDEASKVSIVVDPKDFETSSLTATDTEGFAMKGVPTLSVTTGLKSPYHKPGDDAELIDYDGLEKVSEYISAVTGDVASDPDFAASGKVARKHRTTLPLFEAGLTASLTSSNLNFIKSALVTKSRTGFSVGPQFQLNIKDFGLNAKALYEMTISEFPDDGNLWKESLRYRQQSLTVPVMIIGNAYSSYSMRFFAGFGGYYSYVFWNNADDFTLSSNPVQIEKNQWGISYCLGMQVSRFSVSLDGRVQKNNFFTGIAAPSARLSSFNLTFGYDF
jgi:aminopeptidase YwaD